MSKHGTAGEVRSDGRYDDEFTVAALTGWCSVCAAAVALEQVPCDDGHGHDCPEWVCVQCNYVLVLGSVASDAASASVDAA